MQIYPKLTEIRQQRQIAGWPQRELVRAVKAANSPEHRFEYKLHQTQLSKIENGDESVKIDYRTAVKIFEILEGEITSQKKGGRRAASEVMTRRDELLVAATSDSANSLANKMKKLQISQVPVMTGEQVVGTLTFQDTFVDNEGTRVKKRSDRVGDYMSEPLPTFPASTTVRNLRTVLRNYQAVLLEERGQIVGILSRQDALAL